MLKLRRADERGRAEISWLDSRHTFSFGHYHDPAHMGFRSLRVMNEDRVAPGGGFPTHGHDNMEIVSYVLDGALEHRDSMGNGSVLKAGMFQRMTAGSGVEHSEFNAEDSPLHFYQIWIIPAERGLTPGYEEFAPDTSAIQNALYPIAGPAGSDAAMRIHQDATLYLGQLDAGKQVTHPVAGGRHVWVQVVRGEAEVNGHAMASGDGAAISDEDKVVLKADTDAQVLLFDLA